MSNNANSNPAVRLAQEIHQAIERAVTDDASSDEIAAGIALALNHIAQLGPVGESIVDSASHLLKEKRFDA